MRERKRDRNPKRVGDGEEENEEEEMEEQEEDEVGRHGERQRESLCR